MSFITWRNLLPTALTALLMLGISSVVAAQTGNTHAAQTLAQGSAAERAAALARIRATPVEVRGPEVLPALLEELHRQSARLEARAAALREGRAVEPSEGEGESLLDVLDLVTQHEQDPRIIPALLPFIATGNRVIDVLAAFGERSVSQVADIAASHTRSDADVHSALLTLQRMLQKPTRTPLSADSRQLIIKVAQMRLTGTQALSVALAAVDLAAATRDPALIHRLEIVSQDAGEVRALGLTEDLVPRLQTRAATALRSSAHD
ncbi:MAG: hypothetical protein IRZ28_12130 [Steroidobacteraceae bacterium]|nr:hypothetical protein [Steroidobacteraceae bacterium]